MNVSIILAPRTGGVRCWTGPANKTIFIFFNQERMGRAGRGGGGGGGGVIL